MNRAGKPGNTSHIQKKRTPTGESNASLDFRTGRGGSRDVCGAGDGLRLRRLLAMRL
jgi:hypothetical protein